MLTQNEIRFIGRITRTMLKLDMLEVEEEETLLELYCKLKTMTEKPKTEKPKTEKPKAEEPKAEEPKTEKPKTEKPMTEKPMTEKPMTEKPMTEKPMTEKPKTEKPKSKTGRLTNAEREMKQRVAGKLRSGRYAAAVVAEKAKLDLHRVMDIREGRRVERDIYDRVDNALAVMDITGEGILTEEEEE